MKHKLIIVFFALIASAGTLFAQSGTCGANGNNLTWTLNNGTLTISGTGSMANYDYYYWDGGDNRAPWFDDRSFITKVIINSGVQTIGNGAFYYCFSLTSITIPNSVTSIGGGAFYSCSSLTSVTIPNSVTTIGEYAFRNVSNIVYSGTATGAPWGARSLNGYVKGNLVYRDATKTELLACSAAATGAITIPNSVTSIGGSAFRECFRLTSITIPNSLTSIGDYAFEGCSGLTSVTIPNSVTSIGLGAFYYCYSLTSQTIPNSVTTIGEYAFQNVSNIVYSGTATGAPWGARSLNGYVEGNLVYRDATKTELLACFAATTGEIAIPNSVTSIGADAFYCCTGLTSITIPNSVTSIGGGAFVGCSSLTSITIPNSVTSIGNQAFYDCRGLTSVTIGNSVAEIGDGAFESCDGLTSLTCYAMNPPMFDDFFFSLFDSDIFDLYAYTTSVILYVPANAVSAYNANENWKNSFSQILPIGATPVTTNGVQVIPTDNTVVIQWPTNANAGSYELVIRDKDGNALCTLVFNAQGQLTSIAFAAAPARDRSNVAAMAQGTGFAFTVTGLESGTTYSYTLKTKNASGAVIDTKTGAFTTQSPTALEDVMDDASTSTSVRKVLQNGQLYILRDGKVYNAVGAEVK